MNKQEMTIELTNFINESIKARLENGLQVIKEQLINKVERYLNLLNKENNTLYKFNIEKLVNKEIFKEVI